MFRLYFVFVLISILPGGQSIEIVTRQQWGARSAKRQAQTLPGKVSYVFIHHTASSDCSDFKSCCAEMRKIQNIHMNNNGWSDIGYSYLVGGDGRIYTGRGYGVVGSHTYGYNRRAYGMSFIGLFTNKLPTTKSMEAMKSFLNLDYSKTHIHSNYGLYGHRDAKCTECPGKNFYNHLKTWSNWHKKGKLPNYYC